MHATNEKHLITASISNCKANFKIQTIHYTVVGSDSQQTSFPVR